LFIRNKYPHVIPENASNIIFFELDADDEDTLIDSLSKVDEILENYNAIKSLTSFDDDWFMASEEIRHALPEGGK